MNEEATPAELLKEFLRIKRHAEELKAKLVQDTWVEHLSESVIKQYTVYESMANTAQKQIEKIIDKL